ncbi:MAG: putative multidrug export ATP-binding/permease protein, partial [Candidatus Eremiobacteraeota bacterium]|nr:putative multidrug export ATP-binding/permease protein [Candidatus Eremiobacteraeota bacterium]
VNPTLRRLLREGRPYFPRLIAGTVLGVLAGVAPLTIIKVTGLLRSDVLIQQPHWDVLVLIVALIIGSQIVGNLASYGQAYITAFAGQQMVAQFRARMFDRIARMPLREFDRWRAGEFQSRMSNDLGLMTDALSISLPQFIQTVVTFVGSLVWMITLDWLLAVVLFIAAPIVAWVVNKFNRLIVGGTKRAQERIADLSSNLVEVLANERVVKAFRREAYERDRFKSANERYVGAYMKVIQFNQTQAPVLAFIVMLAICAVVALTAREIAAGRISPSQAFEFWAATGLLINPMNRFSIFFSDFARAFVGAGRVFEILDLPVEPDDPPSARALPSILGDVRFDHVTFAYDEDRTVLSDFSAEMLHGEVVALVGPSGAGKSTIVNLVPRFYELQQGRITVDGVDIADVRLSDLRDAIAIVPQETQLFNGTIAENIRYGRLNASDAEIVAAAQEANADEFVQKLPEGYATVVGERGIRLSGGQRQRIAIARAILRDPRILILDEATSALDSHSESLIEDALDRLLPGRTTLIIAHRLSTIRRATKILYIEGGRVRETGTHEALIAAGGAYADLHAAQFSR